MTWSTAHRTLMDPWENTQITTTSCLFNPNVMVTHPLVQIFGPTLYCSIKSQILKLWQPIPSNIMIIKSSPPMLPYITAPSHCHSQRATCRRLAGGHLASFNQRQCQPQRATAVVQSEWRGVSVGSWGQIAGRVPGEANLPLILH